MFDGFKSYNGNPNIRRAGENIQLTKEQYDEWMKCADDPIYFSEKYVTIIHVDKGLIPINLYDFQKEIIEASNEYRRVVVNTSRQAGKTTTAVCIIIHYIIFNSAKQVGLLANKGDAAREILSRIKLAYEGVPRWMQSGVVKWNEGSIELENKCKVIATATSGTAARGKSFSYVYIDEAGFVENWDTFYRSVFPTITSGKNTKLLFTSTPNGLNHFYKTCHGAQEGTNGFKYIEAPWYKVPGRDEAWKKETLNALNNDMEAFAAEFCCEFMGSSGTLISGSKLKTLVNQRPIHEDADGLRIYKQPNPEGVYTLIADVSQGKGLDYSAFSVIDITNAPYEQVCTFRSNTIVPSDYSRYLYMIGNHYNKAHILVENNDMGAQVCELLFMEYEYENVLGSVSTGRTGKTLTSSFSGRSAEKGIRTTKNVKSLGCSMLKLMIEQEQLILNDENTIDELKTFSRKGVSYEAEPGKTDDLVMGLVLFGWMSSQLYFKNITDLDMIAMIKEKDEDQLMEGLVPFGIYDDGISFIDSESEGGGDDFFW